MTAAPAPELLRRAAELGVAVEYEDVDGVRRQADREALTAVVETLEADRVATAGPRAVDPVLIGATDLHVRGLRDAELLVGGEVRDLAIERGGSGDPTSIELPDDLPVGCHPLRVSTGDGDTESIVVVPPSVMPDLDPARRWSSLFVPAYALWTRDQPLPSFDHLRRAAKRARSHGIDMISTLPLYATFLDEPFDPSPYSPVSRLHWNEAYLDDAVLPDPGTGAPVDVVDRVDDVDVIDWRALGARRRAQLEGLAAAPPPELLRRLDRFADDRPDAVDFARFMANRDGEGTTGHRELVGRSHLLAQMLCEEQLAPLAGGLLSLDLPIGSHPDGYETWAYPELFATGMSVGAPPDTFFTGGQDWGFPPQLPGSMRAGGYALWRRLIERAGEFTTLLRIDHVMAVHRLWWVPGGFEADRGVYVHYPRDELLAVIAATAAATGTAIVGENLGTVPPEVDRALARWRMLGMHEEQFAMRVPTTTVPERAVAGVRTHDMVAFAAYAADHEGDDEFVRYLDEIDADPDRPFDGVLAHVAASRARMVVADVDDLLGEHRPHNLPGRLVPGIWQRRLSEPLDEVFDRSDVRRRLDVLGARTPQRRPERRQR